MGVHACKLEIAHDETVCTLYTFTFNMCFLYGRDDDDADDGGCRLIKVLFLKGRFYIAQ